MESTGQEQVLINKRWFPTTFNLDILLQRALVIAQQTVGCTKAFVSGFTLGSDTVIIYISFDGQGEDLVSKSPLKYVDDETDLVVESEAATMMLIERKTQIPVPHVYLHASTISGNQVGWPYILMSRAKGVQVEWESISAKEKETVMRELAKHLSQLSRITFGQIGSIIRSSDGFTTTRSVHRSLSGNSVGPFNCSRDYFEYQLDLFYRDATTSEGSSRVPFLRPIPHREDFESSESFQAANEEYHDDTLHGSNDWDTHQNISYYRRLHSVLKNSLPEVVDFECRQFVLSHPDLNTSNIFIEPSTYKVTCIIDWERASTIPAESFYVVPHLPDTRAPLDDSLRAVFLNAFADNAAKGNDKWLALLQSSEPRWAFNKLVERDSGVYFHYAVAEFLRWKMGDNWLDLMRDMN
jgi:Phosphotransferase enzyme family